MHTHLPIILFTLFSQNKETSSSTFYCSYNNSSSLAYLGWHNTNPRSVYCADAPASPPGPAPARHAVKASQVTSALVLGNVLLHNPSKLRMYVFRIKDRCTCISDYKYCLSTVLHGGPFGTWYIHFLIVGGEFYGYLLCHLTKSLFLNIMYTWRGLLNL